IHYGHELPTPNYAISNLWMASSRDDYLHSSDPTDSAGDVESGARLVFLYYLFTQLGYNDIPTLVAAAAPHLAGVYRNLTGNTDDPFPAVKALIELRSPGTDTIPVGGPHNFDDPFPIFVVHVQAEGMAHDGCGEHYFVVGSTARFMAAVTGPA